MNKMRVVYVRAWSKSKPKEGYWYPVVFAKELINQEVEWKKTYSARINSLHQQVKVLKEELLRMRCEKNER